MPFDITELGTQKIISVSNGQKVEMKTLWEDKSVAIIFFRRWGCIFCRLWAKELGQIAPVLERNNIKLVGIGVEELGSKEFEQEKFFDGDLYYVEKLSTYQLLGFKRFNLLTILASLLWKDSRDAISKGNQMSIKTDIVGDGLQNGGFVVVRNGRDTLHFRQNGPAEQLSNAEILKVIKLFFARNHDGLAIWNELGGDLKGDWVQTGGAFLAEKGGKILRHFQQTGPAEHLSNLEILKHFGLEHEYNADTMANKIRDNAGCTTENKL